MEREQLNRIRPGGAEEWKQRRTQGGAGEQKASDPQAPAGERKQPHLQDPTGERKQPRPQAPAGTHIQILPQPSAADRKPSQPRLTDEERKAAQDPDEKLKRSYLVKLLAMLVLAGAIVLYTTIAWFTMNKETGSSGMGVKVAGMPFEIAAYGTSGTRNSATIVAVAPTYRSGTATTLSGTTYYATGAGADAIRLQYSTGESEIGPGGSGVLDLYLISKVDGALAVDIDFDVKAYATVQKYDLDGEGNKIQKTENDELVFEEDGTTPVYRTTETLMAVSDITTANCSISAADLASLQSAASYIRGHVMFFENEGLMVMSSGTGGSGSGSSGAEAQTVDQDSSYYFTDPLIERRLTWYTDSTTIDKVHHIPIYWMWPNTLGQILLDGNYNMRSGIPLLKDANNAAEKAKMAAYLKNNKSIVFSNAAEITDDKLVNHPSQADFDLMSTGYNGADFAIGSSIDYFLIEITVSLHTESESSGSSGT